MRMGHGFRSALRLAATVATAAAVLGAAATARRLLSQTAPDPPRHRASYPGHRQIPPGSTRGARSRPGDRPRRGLREAHGGPDVPPVRSGAFGVPSHGIELHPTSRSHRARGLGRARRRTQSDGTPARAASRIGRAEPRLGTRRTEAGAIRLAEASGHLDGDGLVPGATRPEPPYDTVSVCVPLASVSLRVARPGRPIARSFLFSFFVPSWTVTKPVGVGALDTETTTPRTALPRPVSVEITRVDVALTVSVGSDVLDTVVNDFFASGDPERQLVAEIGVADLVARACRWRRPPRLATTRRSAATPVGTPGPGVAGEDSAALGRTGHGRRRALDDIRRAITLRTDSGRLRGLDGC